MAPHSRSPGGSARRGSNIGHNPIIGQADDQVVVLDSRAIITLNGQRMYEPRYLAADDHTADMRA